MADLTLARSGLTDDVKLADFGLAIMNTSSMASAGGTKAGTAWYFSPEKANGKKASPGPVDMWAVGCALVELILGQRLGSPL
jgi:serine/threonine protein kinase